MIHLKRLGFEQLKIRLMGSFSGRAGLVLLGSIFGQGIAFVLLPLTTRIYEVGTIGRAATTLAIISVVGLLATFQYDQAVIVAEDDDLPYLLLLSTSIATTIALIYLFFLLLVQLTWGRGIEILNLYGFNGYLGGLFLAYGIFLLLTNFRLRMNHLKSVSIGRVIYYGGGAMFQVLGGITFENNESVYLLAQGVAALIAVLYLIPYRSSYNWFLRNISQSQQVWQGIIRVSKQYGNFPKYQAGAQFLNALSIQIPIFILRAAFSAEWAGWYFIAYRLLAAPTVLLSQAIGQVFYRDSAQRERDGTQQGRNLEKVVIGLIKVSLLPGVTLGIMAPFFVQLFLGDEWAPVASILRILLIPFVILFFTSPISTLLNVKNQQKLALVLNSFLFFGRTFALMFAWWMQAEWMAVWGYAIASLIILLIFFQFVVQSVGASTRRILAQVINLIVDAGIIVIVASLFQYADWLDRWQGITGVGIVLIIAVFREIQRAPLRFLKTP